MPNNHGNGNKQKKLKEEYDSLSWQIREKELQISRILSKTLFWHEQVDPALAEAIAHKEAFLSAWYEKKKKYQDRVELLNQVEVHLKKVKQELFYKQRVISRYYEQVGLLALQSYQRCASKWRVYENIFAPALDQLRSLAPKTHQEYNPIHFFLAGSFKHSPNLCHFLKKISRPIGERILQLNLIDFLRQQNHSSSLLSLASTHEQEYSSLLRKKRNLENNRQQLMQDLFSQTKWSEFFKSFFKRKTDSQKNPKLIMLELEQIYTSILKKYLDSTPEKVPSNISKALDALEKLKVKKESIQKAILQQNTYPASHLEYIKKSLEKEELTLQDLYARIKEQELKIQELKEKEKSLISLLTQEERT